MTRKGQKYLADMGRVPGFSMYGRVRKDYSTVMVWAMVEEKLRMGYR
jgi:hypothetical protein